jgi:UDP-2,4-diacetamido-2,4,6-trideoxy-beta-L-altropyranose hydrolase
MRRNSSNALKSTILTEGGVQSGFGQVTRCASLYQALKERGIEPRLLIKGDDSVAPVIKDQNFQLINWEERREEVYAMLAGTDIAVIDSYRADLSFYQKASDLAKVAVYFDDTLRLDYPKGIVVNGAVGAEQLNYPQRGGLRYLLGVRFFPLRREFWDVPKKEIRRKIESVLITFGGSDERNLTPAVLKDLGMFYPDMEKIVIVGNGFKNTEDIRRAADSKTRLLEQPSGQTLLKTMLEADAAISASGQTLYELAHIGVPTVAVSVVDNQMGNVRGFLRTGIIEYAGSWEDSGLMIRIRDGIEKIRGYSVRESMKANGQKTVGSQGSREIAKYAYNSYAANSLAIRKFRPGDIHTIFDLSNEESVRKSSFDQNPIPWERHVVWFEKILSDPASFCLIAELDSHPVGQVRFQIREREAIISISLAESHRGVGLGNAVMRNALASLKDAFPAVEIVRAQIREENTASIKYFESCGFRFHEHFARDGIRAVEHLFAFRESIHEH